MRVAPRGKDASMGARNLAIALSRVEDSAKRWAPLPLRLMVGFGFTAHGFAKLSKGPDAFAAILSAMNVPMPHLMAWLTICTELLG